MGYWALVLLASDFCYGEYIYLCWLLLLMVALCWHIIVVARGFFIGYVALNVA